MNVAVGDPILELSSSDFIRNIIDTKIQHYAGIPIARHSERHEQETENINLSHADNAITSRLQQREMDDTNNGEGSSIASNEAVGSPSTVDIDRATEFETQLKGKETSNDGPQRSQSRLPLPYYDPISQVVLEPVSSSGFLPANAPRFPSPAHTMAFPSVGAEMPPPLPPPRHIDDHTTGQTSDWQGDKTNSSTDQGFDNNRYESIRPSSNSSSIVGNTEPAFSRRA
ncbi:hypothetical protein ACEQ8H_008680 [Pleosporales sp. CAS-2024a]